jgi:hypothetical protein
MSEDIKVEAPKAEKSKVQKLKDDSRPLVNVVRDFTVPDLMKIPKPNPKLHYRWGRDTTDNLALLEAQGFHVCTSDEVRECGLTPNRADGAMHRGDLVLCAEDWVYYKEKDAKRTALAKRQHELQMQGATKDRAAGVAGKNWRFQETVKEG